MREGNNFYWNTHPRAENILSYNYDATKGPVFIKWFEGAVTNMCYNAVDRHVADGFGDKIAYYWSVTNLVG